MQFNSYQPWPQQQGIAGVRFPNATTYTAWANPCLVQGRACGTPAF